MHSQPRMYADDTSITYASNDVEEIERCVNIDLDRIRIWLAANKLTLNTTKTEFLLIGSSQRLSTLERNPIIEINQYPIYPFSRRHEFCRGGLGVFSPRRFSNLEAPKRYFQRLSWNVSEKSTSNVKMANNCKSLLSKDLMCLAQQISLGMKEKNPKLWHEIYCITE